MFLELLHQYWHLILWVVSLVWIHCKLNKHQKQIDEKFSKNESKLNDALEKLDVGIFEVKNRTRCKLIDRNNRGIN